MNFYNNKTLSQNSINIIKESAELITAYDTEITQRMYDQMFVKYPEYKFYFRYAPKNQYMKLAEALSAYAVNIERIEVLTPALEVIAKSHVRGNVKPKQYIHVGMLLIEAIEYVLGTRATTEFVDAWREAYQLIADTLIEMESKMYRLQKL